MEPLSENAFYLPGSPETDRPTLEYVRGTWDALMVDAGNSRRHAEQYLSAVRSAGLRTPRYAAVTHSRWDHSFGFSAVPAVSFACRATNRRLAPFCAPWDQKTLERYLGTRKGFGSSPRRICGVNTRMRAGSRSVARTLPLKES